MNLPHSPLVPLNLLQPNLLVLPSWGTDGGVLCSSPNRCDVQHPGTHQPVCVIDAEGTSALVIVALGLGKEVSMILRPSHNVPPPHTLCQAPWRLLFLSPPPPPICRLWKAYLYSWVCPLSTFYLPPFLRPICWRRDIVIEKPKEPPPHTHTFTLSSP